MERVDPWYNLLAAVLLRAVQDVKLERTYGIFTEADRISAQSDAWQFLLQAGPLFDLVGIDHGATLERVSRRTHEAIDQTTD